QAEDGIRDLYVTGVQTCALPIYYSKFLQVGDLVRLLGHRGLLQYELFSSHVFKFAVVAAIAHELGVVDVHRHLRHRIEKLAVVRSEERRVGKECRCGGWREYGKI